MLKTFGGALGVGVLLSLLSGKTYFRRVISKDEEPWDYWVAVICLSFLALFVLGMLYACPPV